jgi:hypothetical protein
VKKIILVLVFLGAAFCLYAQDADEALGSGEDGFYESSGGDALVTGGDDSYEYSDEYDGEYYGGDTLTAGEDESGEAGKKRGGFFGGLLGYLDNPKVTTRHLDRKRIFELRLANADISLGNNLVGIGDIFKKQIVVDLDQMNSRIGDKGAILSLGLGVTPVQISVNPTERWGGSLGTSVLGRFDLSLPKELLDLIAEGNEGHAKSSGEIAISASIFYEIGLNIHGTLPYFKGKLSFGVDPAFYSPLLYIPRSGINYTLDTDDKILLSAGGSFKAYTPINTDSVSIGDIFSTGGIDLSLSAEYALFSRLDLGLSISHIPMLPARMSNGYEISLADTEIIKKIDDITKLDLDNLITDDLDFKGDDDFTSLPALTVFRPMRFEFYNIYRPFDNDIFSVRPNIGFTVLNASEETYLNMGTRITMDLKRLFVLYLDSGLEEGLWRHKLGFELNLRAFELGLEAGMRSQDYLASWTASGLSAKLGIAFGW